MTALFGARRGEHQDVFSHHRTCPLSRLNTIASEVAPVKGFVPTPPAVIDAMLAKLFSGGPPPPNSSVLDPGCGTGAFIEGLMRWSRRHKTPLPNVVGIESDPRHLV